MRMTTVSLLMLLTAAAGCAARGNAELLEARLRTRENELFQLRQQLAERSVEIESTRREVALLQRELQTAGENSLSPDRARQLARITGLRIDPKLTGSLDRDGSPGDDVFNVVLAPHDGFDAVVRLEGTIELELLDLSLPDADRVLGHWRIEPETAATHWHDGFLAKGFQFTLPWQNAPTSPELTLHAKFTTPDGRTFDATHALRVEPHLQTDGVPVAPAVLPVSAPFPEQTDAQDAGIRPIGFERASRELPPERTSIPLRELPPPRF